MTEMKFELENIVEDLNENQLKAVEHRSGPQLVVAGAGTGKTAVITRRIAYLVAAKICSSEDILALTFTDKAAEEMESRVDVLVPYGFTESTICTFHAFGDKLLREHGFLLGLTPNYKVLSTAEQLIFLREHLFDLPLSKLRPLSDPTRHLQLILNVISRAKDEDVGPLTYLNYCENSEARLVDDENEADRAAIEKQTEVAKIYEVYQQLMLENGLVDFGDLITLALKVMREHPDVLADLRKKYKYILVDEFQDTNAAQFEMIRLLAGEEANVTVVGDDDQSIYKFRGAAISNILQFTKFYPQTQINVLTQNYRSTQMILDSAYKLIRHNDPERLEVKHGLDKRLKAALGTGHPVIQYRFETVSAEADWVADTILKDRQENNRKWQDYAILVRAKKHGDPYVRTFNVKGIPLRYAGQQGLYKRPEVMLCTAFLRTLADPSDPLAFHALASSEIYDLPAEDIFYLAATSKKTNLSMYVLLKRAVNWREKPLSKIGEQRGKNMIEELSVYLELAKTLPTGQLLYRFLTESGLISKYTEQSTVESDMVIKNIAKFFSIVQRYEAIAASDKVLHFVQHLDMLEEIGDDPSTSELADDIDAVNILTVHRSKGLEYPVVFMVGLAANRFPSINRQPGLQFPLDLAKEVLPSGDPSISEERRLFYVAMTRAKERLLMTSSKDYGGKRAYKLSRFVVEALEANQVEEQVWQTSDLEKIHANAPLPSKPLKESEVMDEKEVLSLSYYQIDDYVTCPLKYKFVHKLKIPVLPHHSVHYGNALHTAIDEYYRLLTKDGAVDKDRILKTFLKSWVNQGFISREHEEMRQQAGLDALNRFIEKESALNQIPEYVEKSFSFNLGYNKIVGRMDRIDALPDGGIAIIDFKSSEVLEQKTADKKAKESLQLKIYALAWNRIEGVWPEKLSLYFLDSGLIGSAVPEPSKMDKLEELIETVGAGIRSQQFPAKPTVWTCNYCAFRTICPKTAV